MALVFADRVRETSTTEGQGTYALGGAVSGFQSFSAGIGSGNRCIYVAVMGSAWEVGIGTVTGGGSPTLSRDDLIRSSTTSFINWTAGTKEVFVDLADTYVFMMYRGAVRWAGLLSGTAAALTGTVSPIIYEYWHGLTISCVTHIALTNASPTIDFNAIGAASLRAHDSNPIPTSAIGTNQLITVVYDGVRFRITRSLA